jgi:Bacterial RNA polymerase, alpha chain C terminal domain
MEDKRTVGYPEITDCLLEMVSNYYWPLLEEVAPKLGMYEPLIPVSQDVGKLMFETCAERNTSYILIHRDIMQRFTKVFEILEYAGFIGKREASRAMKSGGRGAVFAVNLCNLLDATSGRRLTVGQATHWLRTKEPAEIHSLNPRIASIEMPTLVEGNDFRVLLLSVEQLRRSKAYPYGLTEDKIARLQEAGIKTIGDLADTSDRDILAIEYIGEKSLKRIRDVQYQAIWM